MLIKVVVLTFALVAARTFSQGGESPPPRQTFEKAAYAEEHDRDFQKAAKLYREAGSVAQFLGDQKLADEAREALKRVEARVGKGTDTAASAEIPMAVQRRLYVLVKQLCSPYADNREETKNQEALSQIMPFGAAAVPILEQALNNEGIQDPEKAVESFRGDSKYAALALAAINAPEATAAMLRALKSPDPLVRAAVVRASDAKKHREVLDAALKESGGGLAGAAIERLGRSDDPALRPLMNEWALKNEYGSSAALDWLVRNSLEDAIVAMKSDKLSLPSLRQAADEIMRQDRLDLPTRIGRLAEVAEAISDRDRAAIIMAALHQRVDQPRSQRLDPALRKRVEAIVIRGLETAASADYLVAMLNLAQRVGRLPAARAILNAVKAHGAPPNFDVNGVLLSLLQTAEASEFLEAAAIVRETLAGVSAADRNRWADSFYGVLAQIADKGATEADLVAGLKAVDGEGRDLYVARLIQRQKAPVGAILAALELATPSQRAGLITAFGGNKDKAWASAALPAIIGALSDPEKDVRENALRALQSIGYLDPDAVKARLATELKGHAKSPSDELIRTIGWLPADQQVPALESLWESSPERRNFVASVAIDLSGEGASKFLVKNFNSFSSFQRKNTVLRFGKTLYQPAMDVIGASLSDSDLEVRKAARESLEMFRVQREALDEFKRWKAGDAEAQASYAELLKLLESPDRNVVEGAVCALGAIKAKGALPALVKVIERYTGDDRMKTTVQEAIKKIGE